MTEKEKLEQLTRQSKECKEQVRNLELKEAQLQATRESLMKQLKDEFGIESLEEATKRLDELSQAIKEKEAEMAEVQTTLDEIASVLKA